MQGNWDDSGEVEVGSPINRHNHDVSSAIEIKEDNDPETEGLVSVKGEEPTTTTAGEISDGGEDPSLTSPPPQLAVHSNNIDDNEEYSYQPASCMAQTTALVRKNLLNKIRTPTSTIFELFSPALFMMVLVLGYSLSEESFRDEGIYSSWDFSLPNPVLTSSLFSILGDSVDVDNVIDELGGGGGSTNRRILSRNVDQQSHSLLGKKLSNLDFLFDYDESEEEEGKVDLITDNSDHNLLNQQWKNIRKFSRRLQTDGNTTEEEYSDDDLAGNFEVVANSFEELRRELKQLLKSPMPIPTISQFLTLSQSLSSQFDPNELDSVYQSSDYIRRWGNLLTLGTMHLSPRGDVANEFIEYLETAHNIINITSEEVLEDRPNATSILIRVHDDVNSATNYVMNNLNERTFVVLDFEENNDDFEYTIRMNSTTLPNTNLITRWVSIGLSTRYQRYYFSGHLSIQRTVNEFAISRMNKKSEISGVSQSNQCIEPNKDGWEVFTLPMPTAAYSQNPFFTAVGFLLGLVIAMSFLYPVSRLIKAMVEEKETRMKETLSILGVRPLAQWLSWIITATISSVIVSILVTMTLSRVMVYSSVIYLFVFVLLFSFATTSFAFFIAAFFSRANLAAIVGPVALFITVLPRWIFFGTNRYESISSKKLVSLLPCTAFAFGADILGDYEYAQVGLQKSNVRDGAYSFSTTLGFLFLDTILYLVLGWYFEQVIPRQYGVAKKWYFIITPSFWKNAIRMRKNTSTNAVFHANDEEPTINIEDGRVEYVSAEPKLQISSLVKIYNPKKPPAINGLNLSMYESEITCLLGHNGAGKSSTISVLTGLYPPTHGNCTIYGQSILNDMNKCRQMMGICPQQNVLFNNLSVLEHLSFFQRIKGITVNRTSVEESAREVGLSEFFHTKAGQLSGGNKRKLQLAIALTGDPRVVFLDEPTSGMDPYSRRATWELLRQKRRNRIILLTTHFMDEAEVLADRVAILKDGSLQCCGSVLFLKEQFGLGYNITAIANKTSSDGKELIMSEVRAKMTAFLDKSIPGTRFIRESAREVVFRFPPKAEEKFPTLFDQMSNKASSLCISSYGVSNTSLEEVFLQLADHDEDDEKIKHLNTTSSDTPALPFTYMNTTSQIKLLLHKRFTIQRRDIKGLFFKIVLPVVLICLVLMVLLVEVPIEGSPLELTPELYSESGTGAKIGNNVIVAGSRNDKRNSFIETLEGQFPSVGFSPSLSLNTSYDVSEHILDGLEEGRREFNFGSIVFGDTINTTINVNWEEMGIVDNDIIGIVLGSGLEMNSTLIEFLNSALNIGVNNTDLIEFANNTLLSQNVSNSEAIIVVLEEILNSDSSLTNLFDQFRNNTLVQEEFINSIFNGADSITLEGDGWSLDLSEDQVLSFLNSESTNYDMLVNVPVSIMHNTSSSHSVAAFTQTYYDYLFKRCSGASNPKLLATNYPLPLTTQQSTEIRTILSIIAAMLLAIPFNYIPAAFTVFLVKERSCKSKHLQLVSGVDMSAYWISNYLWDICLYFILTILAMVGFLCFGDVAAVFIGSIPSFFCTLAMIFGYGLSSLPFAYIFSRFFDNAPNAQISIMILFFVTGFVASNAYFIMENIEATREIAKGLRPLFRTWPAYNLAEGFLNLAYNFWESQISADAPSPFSWDACGRQILLLYALAPPYFMWLTFLEYSSDGGSGGQLGRFARRIRALTHSVHNRIAGFKRITATEEDSDVVEEKESVKENKKDLILHSPVVIHDLWKTFPKGSLMSALFRKLCCCLKSNLAHSKPKVAVNNVSIHVDNGVTLGLLGVNGAGKTTTMGILTGDITPTSGEAYVANQDVTGRTIDGVRLARKMIGFCPQADPLLDLMTGRETLKMFGQLRGIPANDLDDTINRLLDRLTLTLHADKVSQDYSGGNKRKLSLGIALIGNPDVLFIDESSSGMDPAARRKIWDLLSEVAKKRAVVLTTHSMEEAEALCNKVAIMIGGSIRCLGGVQHLKQKFLGGYALSISCNTDSSEAAIDDVQHHVVENTIPGSRVSERHGRYLKFDVPAIEEEQLGGQKSLGSLFGELQTLVNDSSSVVASYSISQCTLEQVFINLVKEDEQMNSGGN